MSLVDSVLYFGTWGFGVWKRPVSEMVVAADDPVDQVPAVVLYPNPVRDILRWTGGFEPKSVSCWNMMGQEVPVALRGDGVDVGEWEAGMYVIRLEGRGGTVARGKFLKLGR
ncbi:MAG: T9SS type A sorting domain-containing protein [Bacteroidia bacterium]